MSEIKDSGTRRPSGRLNKRGDTRGTYITHGDSGSRLYECWTDMKRRCYNPQNKRYYCYGAKGIGVCDEWKDDYQSFREWSLNNGYSDDLTIDRIDVGKGYSPENCRWATRKAQANNTTRNRYITITRTMAEWAEIMGVSPDLIKDRINKLGWAEDEAVLTPKLKMGGKRWQL